MSEETGWICLRCGRFNTRTLVCAECGSRLIEPQDTPKATPLKQRVSVEQVARILASISAPPNLRNRRQLGDIEGDYDKWFDGGAIRIVTGYTVYEFEDGSRAVVDFLPSLSVTIEFVDGTRVTVLQEHR